MLDNKENAQFPCRLFSFRYQQMKQGDLNEDEQQTQNHKEQPKQ